MMDIFLTLNKLIGDSMASNKNGRTSEFEISIAALRIAAAAPDGKVTTSQLKKLIPDYIKLTDGDLKPSKTRPNENMYHQIVGNIISHQKSEGNIIADGYAEYTGIGIKITDFGRRYLEKMGYSE